VICLLPQQETRIVSKAIVFYITSLTRRAAPSFDAEMEARSVSKATQFYIASLKRRVAAFV
jgi:hypothetical protein